MSIPDHFIFYSFASLFVFFVSLLLGLSIEKFMVEVVGTIKNRYEEEINNRKAVMEEHLNDMEIDQKSLCDEGLLDATHLDSLKKKLTAYRKDLVDAEKANAENKDMIDKSGAAIRVHLRPCIDVSMFAAMLGISYLFLGGLEHAGYLGNGEAVYLFLYVVVALSSLAYLIKKVRRSDHYTKTSSKLEIFGRASRQAFFFLVSAAVAITALWLLLKIDLPAGFYEQYPFVAHALSVTKSVASTQLLTTLLAISTLVIPLIKTSLRINQFAVDLSAVVYNDAHLDQFKALEERIRTVRNDIKGTINLQEVFKKAVKDDSPDAAPSSREGVKHPDRA